MHYFSFIAVRVNNVVATLKVTVKGENSNNTSHQFVNEPIFFFFFFAIGSFFFFYIMIAVTSALVFFKVASFSMKFS